MLGRHHYTLWSFLLAVSGPGRALVELPNYVVPRALSRACPSPVGQNGANLTLSPLYHLQSHTITHFFNIFSLVTCVL